MRNIRKAFPGNISKTTGIAKTLKNEDSST